MRAHILFHWDASYLKSTLLDTFYKCIPDSIQKIDVTTNSPEVLFGSITDDKTSPRIILPAFADTSIAKINELATFVTGSRYQEIVNLLNKFMEGEQVQRQLLKFGLAEVPEANLILAQSKGVLFDPYRAQLTIEKPEITFFAGSRPLENRIYTYLRTSGFMNRFHTIQHQITNEEALRYLKTNSKPDISLVQVLKDLNTKLAAAKIKRIDLPNDQFLSELMETLESVVMERVDKKTRLATIVDLRTRGDVLRELAAHATIRTMAEIGYKDVDQIEYNEEDKAFIIEDIEHFVEAKINPLFVDEYSKQRSTSVRPNERVKALVLELLNDGKEYSRRQIDAYVEAGTNTCIATISNSLKELLDAGEIVRPRFGFYRKKG